MTADELKAWGEGEVKALIACGVAPLDAQDTVKRVLAKLPEGADPRKWMPPSSGTADAITGADVADARADWYASDTVPSKFTMLLDATEMTDADA
jgi:hypothetical protein